MTALLRRVFDVRFADAVVQEYVMLLDEVIL
jgi:hypothetical protein